MNTCHLRKFMVIFSAVFLAGLTEAGAAFIDRCSSPRTAAMGGAHSALISVKTLEFTGNPASTALAENRSAYFAYSRPFAGIELMAGDGTTGFSKNRAALVYPFKKGGAAGAGISRINLSGIYIEDIYLFNYSVSTGKIKEFYERFQEESLFRTFNRKQPSIFLRNIKTYVGINIKYMRHSYELDEYTKDDPVFSGGVSAYGIGIDLGLLSVYKNTFSVACTLKDLNRPDVGLKNTDRVPSSVILGFGLNTGNYSLAIDLSFRDSIFNADAGAEYLTGILALRAGAGLNKITAGLGISYKFLILDYSISWPYLLRDFSAENNMSIIMLF